MSSIRFGILVQAVEPPDQFVALVRRVEELGFDYLWVADSSLHARYVYVYLTLAALNSHRLTLGTGVTHPFTRHPAVNLNAHATLDELSQGRVVMGIGAGGGPVAELGLERASVRAVREMVDLARQLASGREVHFQGSAFRAEGAQMHYPPHRSLPIYLAATGPKMLALAGETADGVLMQVGADASCIRHALRQVQAGMARGHRDPTSLDASVMLYGSIREDRALAQRESATFAAWIARNAPVYCEVAGIPRADVEAVRGRYSGGEMREALEAAAMVTPQMAEKLTFSGTVVECRARAEALIQAGIKHLTFFPMGSDRFGCIERFARGIMNELRG